MLIIISQITQNYLNFIKNVYIYIYIYIYIYSYGITAQNMSCFCFQKMPNNALHIQPLKCIQKSILHMEVWSITR